ncbi:MAG: 50S ribosomal protein L1 [Gemmatimonadota bacterium]|nr:MAG: 50S ribosomal protein L1 [Gemmatimonadota bacterium]
MRKRSKRYKEAAAKHDHATPLELDEALKVLKEFNPAKFDETVEIVMNLGVDPRKSDQMIRGAFSFPKGIGQARRVIAFADGDQATAATEAGAVEVGGEELVKKVADGWTDFDVAVAVPRMMRFVGKLGKVLGPQGKMPSPKSGTVTDDVAKAVSEFAAGKVEFRTDTGANVHAAVGKKSFSVEDLRENVTAFIEHIKGMKPTAAKGTYIKKVVVSSTMSPGILLAEV